MKALLSAIAVTLLAVNTAQAQFANPRAENDAFEIFSDAESVSGNVLANDSLALSARLISPPVGRFGSLTMDSGGNFTYTLFQGIPEIGDLRQNQFVSDEFEYEAVNQRMENKATLVIRIIGAPGANAGNDVDIFSNVDIEFNNRSQDAVPLNSGQSIRGQLTSSNDKDWFSLFSAGNEEITMELCPQGSSCFGQNNWAIYIFDPDRLTEEIEFNDIGFERRLEETGSEFDLSGTPLFQRLTTNIASNHLYLNYRSNVFDSALIGIIDPCFDDNNSVGLGVGPAKTYLIAVSSVLNGDQDAGDDECGQGRVLLEEPGRPVVGRNAEGETQTFETIRQVISSNFSDDQYAIRITATGRPPLLSREAAEQSSQFNNLSGAVTVTVPEIRIGNTGFTAELELLEQIQSATQNLNFGIKKVQPLTGAAEVNPFRATFNPANNQVVIPRVTDQASGKAYSVILQYHAAQNGQPERLELIEAKEIQ